MKNFFKYAVFTLVFVIPMLSLAAEFRGGDSPSIGKEEKITGDIYMGGGNITSSGTVGGDLLIGGGNVIVSGDVETDIMVGGGNVTILSNIGDDARLIGGTIIINGKIGGDLMVGGGQVTVGGSGVAGDAAIGGGDIRIDAPVAGDLFVGGGNVYINSTITGNVKIQAEKITLGKSAVIEGDLDYQSKGEMVKEAGAVVKGTVDFEMLKRAKGSPKVFAAVFSSMVLWKFFTLFACALVIGLLLRRYSREIVGLAVERPLFELGRGLLTIVIVPIVSVLLLITLIGIPFGVLGLLGFAVMMIFSGIVTPIILGSIVYRFLSKRELEVSWKTILLGVFLYVALGLVPFVGFLIQVLLMLLTLGVIVSFKMKVLKEWR